MKNVLQSLMASIIVAFGMFIFLTFSAKEYEVHVTSDTYAEDVSDWDVQTILDSKGNPVPAKEWDNVLESGDFTPVSVASLELRKLYTRSEGRY